MDSHAKNVSANLVLLRIMESRTFLQEEILSDKVENIAKICITASL